MRKGILYLSGMMFLSTLSLSAKPVEVHGYVAPGFEAVAEEFGLNLNKRGEIGAACTIYYNGEKVVDIWGGYRNKEKKEPWKEDTIVGCWSASKGVGAACLALLHSRNLLDYDQRISHYWPAFSKHGKGSITVRQLLSQQAGLCLFNREDLPLLSVSNLKKEEFLSHALENIIPLWEPGTKYGYHGASEGLLIAELVRRIDPQHRNIGRFFQEEIARPLSLQYWIGLPEDIDGKRLAKMYMASPLTAIRNMKYLPPGARKSIFDKNSIFMRSMTEIKGIDLNDRKYLSFEDPDGNGIGEARALAALYNEFLTGGKRIGLSAKTISLIEEPAAFPESGPIDLVMGIEMPTSLGFMKVTSGSAPFASSSRGYGFIGANGTIGFADPDMKIAFAYAGNYNAFHLSYHEDHVLTALRKAINKLPE